MVGGQRKYFRKEARAAYRIRNILNGVTQHRERALAAGKKPDLEYKAEKGAILSLLLVATNGKRQLKPGERI